MSDTLLKFMDIEIKEADDKQRTITAVGSKEVVDRDGDIVKVDGINVTNYKKNPVVLWAHNYGELPVGKAVGRKVWKENNQLMFKIQFASEAENPKADYVYRLYKGGYLNSFSIGFMPDYESIEYPEQKDRGARRIMGKSELLEISCVPVPANALALIQTFHKAFEENVIDKAELDYLRHELKKIPEEKKEAPKEEELEQKVVELEQKVVGLELQIEEQEDEEDVYKEIFDMFKAEKKQKENIVDELLDTFRKA